jgi:CheY-like chemotaxis protein
VSWSHKSDCSIYPQTTGISVFTQLRFGACHAEVQNFPPLQGTAMPTILLVDDDEGVRRVIDDHLASSGYDVIVASDTTAAFDQFLLHPQIDLCLVDLVMPSDVADGLEFARSVRRQRPDMPMLLMTGYYTAAARAGEEFGNLLYKPVDLETLAAEIRRLLTR